MEWVKNSDSNLNVAYTIGLGFVTASGRIEQQRGQKPRSRIDVIVNESTYTSIR